MHTWAAFRKHSNAEAGSVSLVSKPCSSNFSPAHARFVPPGVCCNFCIFLCPFWCPDATVTTLVAPSRGSFTFCFCVSREERLFPRVGGMAVSSALGGSPQSVVPQSRTANKPRQATESKHSWYSTTRGERSVMTRESLNKAGPHRLVSLCVFIFFALREIFLFFGATFYPAGASHFFSSRRPPHRRWVQETQPHTCGCAERILTAEFQLRGRIRSNPSSRRRKIWT